MTITITEPAEVDLLVHALDVATKAHVGQKRRYLNVPYIAHPIRVAIMATTAGLPVEAIAAALLHDVVEDTGVTLMDLVEAGFPSRTLQMTAVLSKWWTSTTPSADLTALKAKYYAEIAADPDALDLKLLDRTDNLHDLLRVLRKPDLSLAEREWAGRYAVKTHEEILPLASSSKRQDVVDALATALLDVKVELKHLAALPSA